ncbi:unnamed protein product [Phaeothamnion confervicola]
MDGAPDAIEDGEGEKKLSKNQLKKISKGKDKVKDKDPNRFGTPKTEAEKAAAKGRGGKVKKEQARLEYDGPAGGAKKDCTGTMPEVYQSQYVEAAWQEYWEKSGFYGCDAATARAAPEGGKFAIVIPPPNVTGSLHLGHALTGAIEDTLTRWHRMRGDATLYVPGIDHAGIATQSVVEKKLQKDENISRHDLGRDKFVERVWEWKHTYGGKIQNQIRRLGSSVDWSREAFTMDPKLSRAVTEAFCRFHESGLIYRDTRLVNWSCALKSAISDIEVDYIELEGRTMLAVPGHAKQKTYEFGTLTHFAYRVEEPAGSGTSGFEELVVATTRLETMLGDTAVAVHPDDPRYVHLHGRFLVHPFGGRRVPVVTDGVLVDMAFGTGAVKVTPAHDPNDYDCGKRNGLPMINILSGDGSMNAEAAPFTGLMRYDARVAVERALEEKGLLRGKEPNKMRLGVCSRSGDIIEPYLTPQWYVRCEAMADKAVAAVRQGELAIKPAFHERTWFQWLDNCRDWCVSRQLWWGHRIPAYFARRMGEADAAADPSDAACGDRWVVGRTVEEAAAAAAAKLGCATADVRLMQDPDVLDTWFSSGLFPFSVFGWPDKTEDMDAFYPTTLLETGMDILFFWVARMVMMGQQLTGRLPFSTVYLHAMVRDKYGRKMSKSLGNVIDPLEVIDGCSLAALHAKLDQGNLPAKEVEKAKKAQTDDFPEGIPQCGADALRFGLLAYTVQGRDVNLDIQRLVGYRSFCNKLWNATRFAMSYVVGDGSTAAASDGGGVDGGGATEENGGGGASSRIKAAAAVAAAEMEAMPLMTAAELAASPALMPRDRWILSRLRATATECNRCLLNYEFAGLTTAIHAFWLYELCDIYLELVKPVVNDTMPQGAEARACSRGILRLCMDWGLRLAHPVMPFVTEELWQRLPAAGGDPALPPSIMLARYPDPEGTAAAGGGIGAELAADLAAEEGMAATMAVVRAARSLRSDYNLLPRQTVELYIVSDAFEALVLLGKQADDIATLSRASKVHFLSSAAGETPPDGCTIKVVDDRTAVHVPLRGLVDFAAEAAKLDREAAKLAPLLAALEKAAAAPGYEEKVPAAVREANAKKAEELRSKQQSIFDAAMRARAMT